MVYPDSRSTPDTPSATSSAPAETPPAAEPPDDAAFRATQSSTPVPAFGADGEPIQHRGPAIGGAAERAGGGTTEREEFLSELRRYAEVLVDVDWSGGAMGAAAIDDAADVLEHQAAALTAERAAKERAEALLRRVVACYYDKRGDFAPIVEDILPLFPEIAKARATLAEPTGATTEEPRDQ